VPLQLKHSLGEVHARSIDAQIHHPPSIAISTPPSRQPYCSQSLLLSAVGLSLNLAKAQCSRIASQPTPLARLPGEFSTKGIHPKPSRDTDLPAQPVHVENRDSELRAGAWNWSDSASALWRRSGGSMADWDLCRMSETQRHSPSRSPRPAAGRFAFTDQSCGALVA